MLKNIKKLFPQKWKREVKDHLGVPSLHSTLLHLKSVGFVPKCVIDGGAYEGEWALDFLEVFPGTKILMIEGQEGKRDHLKTICTQHKSLAHYIGLLSSENGKMVFFLENETTSHINEVITDASDYEIRQLNTITLDSLLKDQNFGHVNFLKLDVQGHEAEVLKGSSKTMQSVEFCLLEVTLLEIYKNSVLFINIVNQMDELGFQVYDICQVMRRPFDKAIYQMDILFIKKESKIIADKVW